MIPYITHGNDVGRLIDYLTTEVADERKKSAAKSTAEQSQPNASEAVEKSNQDLPTGKDAFLGTTADGHSQYPRQSYPDDLDDDYQPNQRWRIIGGNLSDNPKVAIELLENIIAYRPDIKNPAWHASLSAHPDEKITTQQWRAIGPRFLEEIGLKDVPFLLVQHRDQPQDHVHIGTTEIDVFGNVNNAWREQSRAQMACVKIEEEFGLKKAPREKAARKEKSKQTFSKDSARFQVQEKIEAVLNSMDEPNVAEFVGKLEANRVLVGTKFSPAGEVLGLSYAVPEEKNRLAHLERKRREEVREQKEQEKLLKSVEKANAKSKNQIQLIIREEKPDSEEFKVIAFRGAALGDKYSWENLKNHLNYSPQDNPALKAADERAWKKEFQPVNQSEIKKSEPPAVAPPDSPSQKLKPIPAGEASEPISPPSKPAPKKSFFDKVQSYLPAQMLNFIQPPVEPPPNAADGPPPKRSVEAPAPVRQKEAELEKAYEKPPPTISVFDLAMEKQAMAARISEAFQKISREGFLLAGEEILQLNLDLRAVSIYAEFFFDGHLVTGSRFSKLHRETGEVITFKGSELNIPTLQRYKFGELLIKNLTASPTSLFSDRQPSSALREKIDELNRETAEVRKDSRKVSRDTVLRANVIDEKASEVFTNYYNGRGFSAEDLKAEDIIVLNRVKRFFLEKERTAITPIQTEAIARLQKDAKTERDEKIGKIRQADSETIDDDDWSLFADYRKHEELFRRPLKTGLDAELVIAGAQPPDQSSEAAEHFFETQTREYWRSQPMPPYQQQLEDYYEAFKERTAQLEVAVSPLFNSLLDEDLRSMRETIFIKPGPKLSRDLNDVFVPDGVEVIKTLRAIVERDEWEKYSDKEVLENKLKAATFVLANGNEEEKNRLLDRHISAIEKREQEIVRIEWQEHLEQNIGSQSDSHPELEM